MRHVMLDFETMSTGKEAATVSLGACDFDPIAGTIGSTLKLDITLASNLALGRTVDPDTIMWWLGESDAARAVLIEGQKTAVDLPQALTVFSDFCFHTSGRNVLGSRAASPYAIWSNGSCFDVVIAETAFEACRMPVPWKFWAIRDTRTLFDIAQQVSGKDPKKEVAANPVKHDPLQDALWQANAVIAAYRLLRLNKPLLETPDDA